MAFSPSSTRILKSAFLICAVAFLVCPSTEGHHVTKGRSVVVESRGLNASNDVELAIKRSEFPSDFLFGASTSAVQIEGSATKGGRGPSVWDYFTRKFPEKIADRSNINKSIDSYKRYKKDVKALNNLGVDSYRFSISWTRILPNGSLSGGINQEGIDHYNNLINELIKQGIKPFVTLFHFDSPQALQDKYGGFLSRSIVNDFKDYCEICFKFFGDRVKHWITINEPLMIAQFGYDMGFAAPGRCSQSIGGCVAGNSSSEPYIVSHNMLLAHAAAARLYKQGFQAKQGGEIGISLVGQYFEPYSESPEDVAAVGRALDFYLGWYMDPLVNGDYPRSMRNMVKNRLPTFTNAEKKMVKGSYDFIGINYYTSRYVKSLPIDPHALPVSFTCDSFTDLKVDRDGKFIGEKAEGSAFLYIYPHGLQKLLEYMKEKYQSPKIYITENGITEARNDTRGLDVALNDQHRINFVLRHLYRIHEALKNGVNVKGYFYWSLFDSFEFEDGYNLRFGLYYIDYKDHLKRIPKKSVEWFHDFLHQSETTHPF